LQARNQAQSALGAKELQKVQMQRLLAQAEEDKWQAKAREEAIASAKAKAAREERMRQELLGAVGQQDFNAGLPMRDDTGGMMPPALGAQGTGEIDAKKVRAIAMRHASPDVLMNMLTEKPPKPVANNTLEIIDAIYPPGHPARQKALADAATKATTHAPVPPMFNTAQFVPPGQTSPVIAPVDARTGQAGKPFGGAPPRADASDRVSPTLQKKLIEIAESADAGAIAISQLDEALKYSPQAYSGYYATQRATARSNLPGGGDPSADATIQYDNIIRSQALESLKATFGAMPTEGERKVLIELQASADKTHGQRVEIIQRAQKLAKDRIDRDMKIADDIRAGKYSTLQGVSRSSQPGPALGSSPNVASARSEAQAAINKGADRAAVAARFKQMTGQDL
jgi:hypothetical protein